MHWIEWLQPSSTNVPTRQAALFSPVEKAFIDSNYHPSPRPSLTSPIAFMFCANIRMPPVVHSHSRRQPGGIQNSCMCVTCATPVSSSYGGGGGQKGDTLCHEGRPVESLQITSRAVDGHHKLRAFAQLRPDPHEVHKVGSPGGQAWPCTLRLKLACGPFSIRPSNFGSLNKQQHSGWEHYLGQ